MSVTSDDGHPMPLKWEYYRGPLTRHPPDHDPEYMNVTEWSLKEALMDEVPTKVHVARFCPGTYPGDRLQRMLFSSAEELATFIDNDVSR
jgi:hypothetical protein